ncbi:hypothetical protein TUM17569_06890 [Klebsiella oxytoca]|nr:hypothetical protein TUM17569_06890 [Klebsiella oxytoca]
MSFETETINGVWFIKLDGEYIGGRYDTQEAASYASANLSITEMDEIWMSQAYHVDNFNKYVEPINMASINDYLADKQQRDEERQEAISAAQT